MARNVAVGVAATVACAAGIRYLQPSGVAYGVSFASAYAALACFAAALCIGPWQVLRGRRPPLSSTLRRDFGIWAAILGLVHTVFGLGVHLGNPWLYFFDADPRYGAARPRLDAFGLANDLGLAAALVLLVLLTLSSDRAMALLGARRWKAWQKSAYWAGAATGAHAAIYQVVEGRTLAWALVCWLLFGFAVVLQWAGRRAYRARSAT